MDCLIVVVYLSCNRFSSLFARLSSPLSSYSVIRKSLTSREDLHSELARHPPSHGRIVLPVPLSA